MKNSIFELLQPVGLQKALRRYANYRKERRVDRYWSSLSDESIKIAVDNAITLIGSLTDAQMQDIDFLEKSLLPRLGLNNEMLHEQPLHLKDCYGKGLHIWQYPIQFAPFLAWLAANGTGIKKYLEIGVRWGGTFIAVSEFLRRVSPAFKVSIAVDPITPSPLMKYYLDLGRAEYCQSFSTAERFKTLFDKTQPDFVFIDGDHTLQGVIHDFDICSESARIIAFHDVFSQGCVDTTLMWHFLKRHCFGYGSVEFTEQYPSVPGYFMGIGVLTKNTEPDARGHGLGNNAEWS